MTDQDTIAKAMDFSTKAHEGQLRHEATQIPYIAHIAEVAELVSTSGGSAIEVAAAWLHDIVEHTETTIGVITAEFGEEMSKLIDELTDPKEFEQMPIAERKDKQAARVKEQSLSARRIKLADQTSNVQVIGGGILLDADPIESLDYLVGAKKIADACAGVSPLLDTLFASAFEKGMAHYRHI